MPDQLALKAFADEEFYPGAAFLITLPTPKNPLSLLPVGPSDSLGEHHLSRETLARLYADAGRDGIMDYGPPRGELHVRVANRDDIARLREGYRLWHSSLSYPDGYERLLDAVELTLRPRAGQLLRVVASALGGSFTVHGSVQHA